MADEAGIIRELAIVQDSLLALPDDAFAEKYELRRRQEELREQAARFAVDQDEGRSDAELLSELTGLRSQRAKLDKQKINLVSQAGGGPGESTMGDLDGSGINASMMEASGGTRTQAPIGVIKGVLKDRGVDVPDTDLTVVPLHTRTPVSRPRTPTVDDRQPSDAGSKLRS